MNFILILIICILSNVLSKYVFKAIEEFRNIKKAKNIANNMDFSKIDFSKIDKDFYNDLNIDDIENEK